MNKTLLRTVLLVGLLGLPLTAFAANSAVQVGVNLYRHGDYKGAVVALDTALKNGVNDASDRATARIYLASADEARGDKDQARAVLTQLFQEQPGTPIDSALFPPSFIQLAESVRGEVAQNGAHLNPPPGQPAQAAMPGGTTSGAEGSEVSQAMPRAADAAFSGFALGLRFGYAIPGGTALSDSGTSVSQSDVYSGALLGELDLGWRFNPYWALDLYLGIGSASVSSNLGGGSNAEVQVGLEGEFHLMPFGAFDPWFGLGLGYEGVGFKDASDNTWTIGGGALRVEAGGDLRVGGNFVVGPVVTANFGTYSAVTVQDSSGNTLTSNVNSSSVHEWFTFGARVGMVF